MVPFRHRHSREARRSHEQTHNSNPFEWNAERDKYIMTFPIHPLPSMQAPFEESMLDATGETGYAPFQNPNKTIEQRQQLLCRDVEAVDLEWNFTYNCHWRNHPKGKYHPLLKTIAQIVFGVHLLHQHLEKSVADVADILLKHVNELDSFLQRANEDVEGSLRDMLFRRKCLKVPMEHVNEFDRLLDDRMYRAQLLDGNVTIERTINRMSELLNDYLIDMSTFRDANQDLHIYLSNLGDAWAEDNDDVGRIYSAMCGNTAGWAQFLQSLVAKSEKLGVVLVQVSSYCNEIEKRCGAASRRSLIASRSSSRNSNSRDTARSFRSFSENKPLPMVPNERPPFMTSPLANSEAGSGDDGAIKRRPSNRAVPSATSQVRIVANSDSDESLKRRDTESSSTVAPEKRPRPPESEKQREGDVKDTEFYQDSSSSGHDADVETDTRDDPDLSRANKGKRPQYPLHSDSDTSDTIVPKRIEVRGVKGDGSPPLTGKDSAYSSVSGGSFASPMVVQPRSASSQSSYPRAQFGLFPSSSPGTPKHSISGRHGAMSPAFSTPKMPDQPAYYPVQRSQSSLDNHNSSSRRLLKKSSLSSLKRLFSKKKQSSVDTIAE
ncbi:uncharacterized protein BDR25DRAFT_33549 [Lindgomyces ingoldianus]|uniref:Uncharacterized protein n=1 Tax=Lindgomyces ingoldianus TaxID=673940 RepID=A0ACB6QVR7_9PLEO|nr:uncharacterized protein BDR25DRAFT_33549 [Lindgomyces ingoldianus]KAF2470286.1 hypothetical protein BDR25DRAFT_33549 [Lindgomyces ingoldianus]